ncbi:MAG: aromatic amino acid transport family protein [Candidatus Magasanikbacteria bacterium]
MQLKSQRFIEKPVEFHQGFFRRRLTLWEGVALIVSSTVGAGVLGIPYAVSRVGLLIGMLYIFGLGILFIGFNLLLGEVVVRTRQSMQLSGLARKYLGRVGEVIMTSLGYLATIGVLVIYIIGEGDTLSALFGGSNFIWSIVFFCFASALIIVGMRTIKIVEFLLTLGILFVIVLITAVAAPHMQWLHVEYTNFAYILFPYGVILFAFNASAAVPEAHTLFEKKNGLFKKAILISGAISIAIYAVFALITVGVTGLETTEIATIGLGKVLGSSMNILGNIFAFLAMGTSFLIVGLGFRDSLAWDYKFKHLNASFLVVGLPFIIFLLGLRQFIAVMDFVGGVFMSIQMLLILVIYWQAKQKGDIKVGKYKLHHTLFLMIALVFALTIGAIYSVAKLF